MKFSNAWKGSKQPRKQRKYRYNAPAHTKGTMLVSHLSKDLMEKHKKRSLRVRIGDKVKIMRGQFKGIEGKVEKVNTRTLRVFVEKAEVQKKDGSKALYPIDPSNLLIIALAEDKRRLKRSGEKK
jgi:large subunit ribosomal protein L24